MPLFSNWLQIDSGYYNYGTSVPSSSTGIYNTNLVLYVDATKTASYSSSGGNLWRDLSGNNRHMTLYNSTYNGINAIVFNGTNTYTITPNLITPFTTSNFNQTQEVWLNNINNAGNGFTNGVVISELGQTTINDGWHDSQMEIVNGVTKIRVWDQAIFTAGNTTGPKWTHIAWRYSVASGCLDGFVNGIKVVTSGNGNFRQNPFPGYYSALGPADSTSLGNGGYYSGLIGVYRTYNEVLSDQIIYQNYLYDSTTFLNGYSKWTGGTQINITGGLGNSPYSSTNVGAPTNWPVWQLFYANQNISFNRIRQYTNTNGNNSWQYYLAVPPTAGSINFSGANVVGIGSQTSVSYVADGFTTTTLSTSVNVNAGNYFLLGCVNGPYYKVFNNSSTNYVFMLSGVAKCTMINQSYYISHSSGSQTMEIPTDLGGSRVFNKINGIWCIGLDGIS